MNICKYITYFLYFSHGYNSKPIEDTRVMANIRNIRNTKNENCRYIRIQQDGRFIPSPLKKICDDTSTTKPYVRCKMVKNIQRSGHHHGSLINYPSYEERCDEYKTTPTIGTKLPITIQPPPRCLSDFCPAGV